MTETKQRIAAAVRAARKEMGLTQQEVADKIGTTLETVSKTERGTSAPSVEVFLAMVRVLQLEIDDLISDAVTHSTASTKRARLQAEVTTTARAMADAELQLFADFGKLLGQWRAPK
jgi:transcriptional regulator with XRE-family HTH domain